MAGHYPNADIAKLASEKYLGKDIKFVIVKEPDLIESEAGDHAGKWETSLMMFMFPEFVDLERMNNKEDKLRAVDGIDPSQSSVDYGKEMLDKMISKITVLLK